MNKHTLKAFSGHARAQKSNVLSNDFSSENYLNKIGIALVKPS